MKTGTRITALADSQVNVTNQCYVTEWNHNETLSGIFWNVFSLLKIVKVNWPISENTVIVLLRSSLYCKTDTHIYMAKTLSKSI